MSKPESRHDRFRPTRQLEDAAADAHVVSAHDASAGGISFDDLGQPRWTWATDADRSAEGPDETFDCLKALDNAALSLADAPGAAPDRRRASTESGYNPYDTARIDVRGKFGRR